MNLLAQAPDFDTIEEQGLPGFNFRGATLGEIVSGALPYVFFFAGILLLIYFIIGGYRLMFSAGDPKAVADGKSKITHAIIGFIIVFAAFWIVQIVVRFLGLPSAIDTFQGVGSQG